MRKKWVLSASILTVPLALVLGRFMLDPGSVSVRSVPVERSQVEATITNSKAGTVRARHRAELSPETGGRVVDVPFREGDSVERGDVIVALNDASERAELLHARRSLTAAEAALKETGLAADYALRELTRKRSLAERAVVSEEEIDRVLRLFEQASVAREAQQAEVQMAQAAIAVAEAELAKSVIRAPFDGLLAELDVEVGEWITPESPYIAVVPAIDVIDPTSLYVSAPMDEVDAGRILVDQRAKVTIDTHPGQQFPAHVVRVAPYVLDVESQNRTVEIEVELDDREFSATLLPGTSADVEVVLEARDGVPRIPTTALMQGDRVLLVQDGRLVERSIEIGLKNWDYAEVTRGLAEGQRVVVSLDRDGVEAGARVELEDDGRP